MLVELDEEPTLDELSEAPDSPANGQSPWERRHPCRGLEVLQGATDHRASCTKSSACAGEKVPQDMKDANIITLYKNKVDRSDCNNYRGITLLSIVGKLFARITLKRLQVLAENATDMVFSLR